MNKKYDELYNKFIDNELSNEEIKKINELSETDKKFKVELRAHKFVHNSLLEIPLLKAPIDITAKVMEQIVGSIYKKYEKNYFFRIVLGIFGIMFVVIIILFFQSIGSIQSNTNTIKLFEYLKPYSQNIIPKITSLFNSSLIKTIISLLSLIILLFFYFTMDEHKKFRKRINQF